MKSVIFLVQFGAYQKGQIAGFPPDHADQLIARKVAQPWVAPKSAPIRKGAADTMVKK